MLVTVSTPSKVVTVEGVSDAQHVHRVLGRVTMSPVPAQVVGGQLRILQVSARSAFDVGSCEADTASRAKRVIAISESDTAHAQREMLYDVVSVNPVDASPGDGPGFSHVEVHLRGPGDIGVYPAGDVDVACADVHVYMPGCARYIPLEPAG